MFLFGRLVVASFVLVLAACTGEGETGYPGVTVSVTGEKPYVEQQGETHTGKIEITALRDVDLTDIELGSSKLSKKDISKKEWVTLSSDNPDQMVLKRGDSTGAGNKEVII